MINSSAKLLYSDAPYKDSPYIIELYDDGSIHIIHTQGQEETIVVTPEEARHLFVSGLLTIKDFFDQLTESAQEQIHKFCVCLDNYRSDNNPSISDTRIRIDKESIKDQLTNTYQKLQDSIKTSYEEAIKQNKNLLIACGEWHNTLHSFVIELMISKICHDLSIKNLMIESATFSPLEKCRESYEEDVRLSQENPEYAIITLGVESILHNTNYWEVLPIDSLDSNFQGNDELSWETFSTQGSCGLKTRAIAMNKAIASCNQSSFSITGAAHVFDMCVPDLTGAPDLRPQYVILAINTAPIISPDTITKIQFVENFGKDLLRRKLTAEFIDLSNKKKGVDSDEFSKYEEEKESNLTLAQRFDYMQSPKVMQVPNPFSGQSIKVSEAVAMTLNVMKENDYSSNSSNTHYLQSLEQEINDSFKLIDELALNMHCIDEKLIGDAYLA